MDGASHAALQGCVASLRSSMQLLDSSINILDAGVSDYPRLSRHFELVSEPSLRTAQQTLLSSLEPELDNLLSRVEVHLDKLARREQSLMAKAELQEGRLSNASRPSGGSGSPAAARGSVGAGEALTEAETRRLMQLRQKKERLSYAVGRLELQSTQRERQLRKSMAAQ
ncbi:hypothetical protein B0A48_18271 [Cryoendolithus antarcticus]|uniref:DASH complex subunit SPC19 n=1 Tax=Cryoendolithus antarcticus TaxID=1507870 RepID=A0A1V8SA44_9PEZI|nr:hypothetical protein B0A48_18271 [Cryoendolithus antarcticus]